MIARPCWTAIWRQGLRSAECSQPQPRSSAKVVLSWVVQARPPSRERASMIRQSTCAERSRRPAAIPAAPPPMIATSVSRFVTCYFAMLRINVGDRRTERGMNSRRAPLWRGNKVGTLVKLTFRQFRSRFQLVGFGGLLIGIDHRFQYCNPRRVELRLNCRTDMNSMQTGLD